VAQENVIETDVLVIGGGQAGFFAAIKAREQGVNVTLVDKGYASKAGHTLNPWMFDVFVPEQDDLDTWVKSGHGVFESEYLDNPEWVEIVFKESLARWQDLCSWGLKSFKWDTDGKVFISPASQDDGEQLQSGGNAMSPVKARRFVPGNGVAVMREQAAKTGVNIIDRITITDLIKQDGRIVGAIGIPADSYDTYIFKAKAVVICTGTAGIKTPGIRTVTTTGDGDAMAYRVGCEITGKEWNDNHPVRADFPAYAWTNVDTDHFVPRNEPANGVRIYDADGNPLESIRLGGSSKIRKFFPFEGLAMAFEAHEGRAPFYFDVSGAPDMKNMPNSPKGFPREECDEIAMKEGKIRMVFCRVHGQSFQLSDGIWPANTNCATQVPGLYAAGDSIGARPGYPMAGFAMTYCSVTGTRAGISAAEYAKNTPKIEIDANEIARVKKIAWEPMERKGGFGPRWVTQVIQNTMAPYWVLYVKRADRLQAAITTIEFMRDNIVPKLTAKDPHELRLAHEVKSMILHSEMKLRASLFRTESRGTHYREDYPSRDDPNWLAWIKIKEENGSMKLIKEPVPKKWWPDLSQPYEERYSFAFPGETVKK